MAQSFVRDQMLPAAPPPASSTPTGAASQPLGFGVFPPTSPGGSLEQYMHQLRMVGSTPPPQQQQPAPQQAQGLGPLSSALAAGGMPSLGGLFGGVDIGGPLSGAAAEQGGPLGAMGSGQSLSLEQAFAPGIFQLSQQSSAGTGSWSLFGGGLGGGSGL